MNLADSIFTLGITQVIVPVGPTLAVFCQPLLGQQTWAMKALLGSSCEILPPAIGSSNLNFFFGTTMAGATLAALSGKGWPLHPVGATMIPEIFEIEGPASFYISSLGTTSIIAMRIDKGAGY